ncbi:PIG-L family deacetylase [Candidatus Halobeggiatoa sp. HSG11]|nr:PIG-L family deacetylase [Candidatus Halobeggiatoa sp. HSG11]
MESNFIPYTATTTLPKGNVLVLAPHPDDEIFGCAGSIIQNITQGNSVKVVIMTDGSAAIEHSDNNSRLNYIKIRQQESNQAAKILGYGIPEFWGIVDRKLTYNAELVQRLCDYINNNNINYVYAPSLAEIHPDHSALANLAVEAARCCSVKLIMYEIGIPLHPNILLDITPYVKYKKQAMNCFVSQLKIQEYHRHILCLNGYRSYTLPSQVTEAEAYYIFDNDITIHPWQLFGSIQSNYDFATLTKELDSVYKSYSWRLTTPLRWLNAWKLKFFSNFIK